MAAITSGRAYELPLGPDLPSLGSTTAQQVTGALAVVPILLTAVGRGRAGRVWRCFWGAQCKCLWLLAARWWLGL